MPDEELNALLRKMHSRKGKAIIVELTPSMHEEIKNMLSELEAEEIKELKAQARVLANALGRMVEQPERYIHAANVSALELAKKILSEQK